VTNDLSNETTDTQSSEAINLIGRTIEYRYGESVYHVTVDTDSTLHWQAMAGEEKGVVANETYKLHRLEPQRVFITWGEENGIGVSQVLDFEKGIVYNHLLRGRDVSIGTGEIHLLSD
jgi:hypothetical protein